MNVKLVPKPVVWLGSSLDDLVEFPSAVQKEIGHALFVAQCGGKHVSAKPLKGFQGAGVLEVVEAHAGNAFRLVYTLRFKRLVFVLHVFQKKSTHGVSTSKYDIEIMKTRMKTAADFYAEWERQNPSRG